MCRAKTIVARRRLRLALRPGRQQARQNHFSCLPGAWESQLGGPNEFFSPWCLWCNLTEFSLLSWQKLSCSRRGMCLFAKVRNVTPFVAKTTGHDGQGASPLTPPRGKMSHWCRCPESASATSWEISPDPQTSLALDGITGYHWDVPYFGSLQLSFHGEMARLCQTYKCHWSHVSGLIIDESPFCLQVHTLCFGIKSYAYEFGMPWWWWWWWWWSSSWYVIYIDLHFTHIYMILFRRAVSSLAPPGGRRWVGWKRNCPGHCLGLATPKQIEQ